MVVTCRKDIGFPKVLEQRFVGNGDVELGGGKGVTEGPPCLWVFNITISTARMWSVYDSEYGGEGEVEDNSKHTFGTGSTNGVRPSFMAA